MKSVWIALCILLALLSTVSCHSDYAVTEVSENSSSIVLTLEYTGNQTYYIKPSSPIIKKLRFTLFAHTYYDFYFKIQDYDKQRYEIPEESPFPKDPQSSFSYLLNQTAVTFSYTKAPFDFKIVRKDTGAVLFSTYENSIVFSDHYLEIGTNI
jgi:hypothetical protein